MIALVAALLLAAPAAAQDPAGGPAPDATEEAPQGASTLDRAYQKEFAFLRAEKQGLEQRLSALEADRARRLGEGDRALDQLQARLLALGRDADRAEALLSEAERASDRASEGAELLQSTLSQAAQTLERPELVPAPGEATEAAADSAVPDSAVTEAQAQALARLFAAAAEDLALGGALRIDEGSFFAGDGAAVRGRVVSLGEVARYGVSAQATGALVPAGEGKLRLVEGAGAETAAALAGGSLPAVVGLHSYESLQKRVEERREKTLADTMEAGGLVGWVIVLLGVGAALLAVARAGLLLSAGRGVEALVDRVASLVRAGRLDEARAAARGADSAAGRVLAALLEATGADRSREHLEGVGAEALLREAPRLERFQATLRVVAAVAPLLGLLGTVTGMIATFELITEYGTGDPKMLSTGISQALITTELGLVVAIPALLVGNVLKGRADQVLGSLETGALAVLNAVDPDAPQLVRPAAERAGA